MRTEPGQTPAGDLGRPRKLRKSLLVAAAVVGLTLFLAACTNPPTAVAAVANPDGTITLYWTAPSDAGSCSTILGYGVYISTVSGGENPGANLPVKFYDAGTSHTPVTTDPSARSYVVSGLQPGTTYFFVVSTAGEDSSGSRCFAGESDEVSATTPGQRPGVGPVVVTLSWSSTADLDLHVVEPDGTEIYYNNTTAADGGTYGVDANSACTANVSTSPAETVTWANYPVSGNYTAKVEYYSECPGGTGQQNFTLSVTSGGNPLYQESSSINAAGDEIDYQFKL